MFNLTLTSLSSDFVRASSAQRLLCPQGFPKISWTLQGVCKESAWSLLGGTPICIFLASSLPQSCISLAKDHFSGGILLPLLCCFRAFNNAKVENFEIRRIFFLFFFHKNAFFFVFE